MGNGLRTTSVRGAKGRATVTPRELEAQILRYYHVEKWLVGTIATQLGVHSSVVIRVLAQAGQPTAARPLVQFELYSLKKHPGYFLCPTILFQSKRESWFGLVKHPMPALT